MILEDGLDQNQQQLLIDGILRAAVTHGIISKDTTLHRPESIYHLLNCLGDTPQPRKKIVEFKEGAIIGRRAMIVVQVEGENGLVDKSLGTSVVVSEATEGKGRITWFETINTIYIMAPGGKPIEDLRVTPSE